MSPSVENKVILVNELDEAIGLAGKMHAHEHGLLHRAFSVFIFDHEGRLLLQQRAREKYHSGSLWTNSCCSHPLPGENIERAAHRRLVEELGFDCPLVWKYSFIYHSELDQGLTEHELDHVFFGTYEGKIAPNPHEVASYRYVSLDRLEEEMQQYPKRFTAWFKITFPQMKVEAGNYPPLS